MKKCRAEFEIEWTGEDPDGYFCDTSRYVYIDYAEEFSKQTSKTLRRRLMFLLTRRLRLKYWTNLCRITLVTTRLQEDDHMVEGGLVL